MVRLRNLSEDTALFPWKKSTPYPALVSTMAVVASLLLGEGTGHRSAGSVAAGAAFTVGFAVFHEALSSTLLSMAVLTVGLATATLAGSLAAGWTFAVLLLCVVAALNYGLVAPLDPTASWIAQQCGVFVVINSYFANGVRYAFGRTAMVVAGGVVQMLMYWAFRVQVRSALSRPSPGFPLFRQVRTRTLQIARATSEQLRWSADGTGYVVKLCITLGLSTACYRYFHWKNGYWAPMTAMLVLKPEWASTLSRGIARLLGTLLGASLIVLVVHRLPPLHHAAYFVLIAIAAYGCFALQAVNYALFSASITLYTIFLFGFGGFSERSAADLRLVNTAIGGCLALLVDFAAKYLGPPVRRAFTAK